MNTQHVKDNNTLEYFQKNYKDAIQFPQHIKKSLEHDHSKKIGRVHLSAAISSKQEDDNVSAILERLENKLNELTHDGKSLHITTT